MVLLEGDLPQLPPWWMVWPLAHFPPFLGQDVLNEGMQKQLPRCSHESGNQKVEAHSGRVAMSRKRVPKTPMEVGELVISSPPPLLAHANPIKWGSEGQLKAPPLPGWSGRRWLPSWTSIIHSICDKDSHWCDLLIPCLFARVRLKSTLAWPYT